MDQEMIGKNIGNIDLIAVQLVEEMRMGLNDIPHADEYKDGKDRIAHHMVV